MRVLHAGALLSPPLGIIDQMMWEQQAAERLNLAWDVRLFCPPGSMPPSKITAFSSVMPPYEAAWGKLRAWFRLRHEYQMWLEQMEDAYDVIILRYYVHDPFQWSFVRRSRRAVWLVHHTREVPELALDGAVGWLRAALDAVLAPPTFREVAGIIGVTREIVEYEKARARTPVCAAIYPNGIYFGEDVVADRRTRVPEFLFIASGFAPWHGLDILLSAMRKSREEFVLHVVGAVFDSDLRNARSDSRVRLYGLLPRSQIREIAASCSVGLSSFGLHRKGMHEACTLKVREYLMMGLPVFAGYRDVFPSDFPFFYESSVNVGAMVGYARRHATVSRQSVSQAARPFIDKQVLLERLAQQLSRSAAQRASDAALP